LISPSSRRRQTGSARVLAVLLLAVVMFVAGAATTWWYFQSHGVTIAKAPAPPADFGPLTPPTTAAAAPATEPTAPPVTEGAPPATEPPVKTAPPVKKPVRPPVTVPGPSAAVADLLGQAEAAVAAKRFADAAELYQRALKLDPSNEAARAGAARVAKLAAARSFVLGTTVVESLRAVGKDLDGFDTSGVGVKRAPRVEGTVELVMQPPSVEEGKPYAVMVFLKNDGKKAIEVDDVKVSMIVDGQRSTRPVPPRTRQVPPQQRVLIEELPGVWKAGVGDWAVEAVVTAKNQDVYKNRLTWK
jgi:hypothetical protein